MQKWISMRILALPLLWAAGTHAQELYWKNPGNYDFTAHNNAAPPEPSLPPGTPPGFDAAIAHPASQKYRISGMEFLSDGRMVVTNWENFGRVGVIYLLTGVEGDKESIKAVPIATGIWEPYGLKVLNDEIFYTAQDGLWKLVRTAISPEKWEIKSVAKFIVPIKPEGGDFPIAFNTTYANGKFYFSTGAYKNFNAPPLNEGYVVQIDPKTGAQEILGRGIRMPNGLGVNGPGDLFYADNQGEYRPASEIFHVVKGRHYGMAAPDGKDGNTGGTMTKFLPLPPADSIAKPAICIPYRPGSASPTNMFYLQHTQFAGQFLIGDNAYGVVHRIFLEKVKGEYQGANFQFSGVLEGGIQTFAEGPDGTIYGGTLGLPANGWLWLGKEDGMMKWKPNSNALSSIISVSSQREGFDLKFTEPLSAAAANPDYFWVTSYRYEATSSYGGPKLDVKKMKVASIKTSTDRQTLALSIEGLTAGRVYRIDISPSLKTASGAALWTKSAWYTLNQISDAEVLGTGISGIAPVRASLLHPEITMTQGKCRIQLPESGRFEVRLFDMKGSEMRKSNGVGPATSEISLPGPGIHFLKIGTASGFHSYTLGVPR